MRADVGLRNRMAPSPCGGNRSEGDLTPKWFWELRLSRSGERNAENVLEIEDAALAERLAAYVDEVRARYPRYTPSRGQTP